MVLIKRDEKITTNFEPNINEDLTNKGYLDEKLLKINSKISSLENDYNECKLQYNKQSVEEVLVQRAVKTTIQLLYDKDLFDNYANGDKVSEGFFIYNNTRFMILTII